MTAGRQVQELLKPGSGLRLGDPTAVGALTLFPVFHDGGPVPYLLFGEALAGELIDITEVGGGGSVPRLMARNRADQPVLLVEGEILTGMKQTRVLNVTVLVPAKSNLTIPVSCVEEGRWSTRTASAGRDGLHLAPYVRAEKTVGALRRARSTGDFSGDQWTVWRAVRDRLMRHAVGSATASFADVNRARSSRVREMLAGLHPEPGQTGVLAIIGRSQAVLDVFDRPPTLEALWDGLVGSYATDALVVDPMPLQGGAEAEAWLHSLGEGTATEHSAVGLGTVAQIAARTGIASALILDEVVVHLAAFGRPEEAPQPASVPARREPRWFHGELVGAARDG